MALGGGLMSLSKMARYKKILIARRNLFVGGGSLAITFFLIASFIDSESGRVLLGNALLLCVAIHYIWLDKIAICPWCANNFLRVGYNLKSLGSAHLANCAWYNRTECAHCGMPNEHGRGNTT